MSGSGIAANKPKRPGLSCTSFAPYSLHPRVRRRVASLSPNHSPGLVTDTTAAATPALSMSSIERAGVHSLLARCSNSRPLTDAIHSGGEK